MKPNFVAIIVAVSLFFAVSRMASAHHSMTMYDSSRDTTFKATITEFDWANPHSQIIFTATDEHGSTEKWVAEGPGPNRLIRHGWSKDSLKPGDEVTIIGNCNKNGSQTMRFNKVIFSDGHELEARPRYF